MNSKHNVYMDDTLDATTTPVEQLQQEREEPQHTPNRHERRRHAKLMKQARKRTIKQMMQSWMGRLRAKATREEPTLQLDLSSDEVEAQLRGPAPLMVGLNGEELNAQATEIIPEDLALAALSRQAPGPYYSPEQVKEEQQAARRYDLRGAQAGRTSCAQPNEANGPKADPFAGMQAVETYDAAQEEATMNDPPDPEWTDEQWVAMDVKTLNPDEKAARKRAMDRLRRKAKKEQADG